LNPKTLGHISFVYFLPALSLTEEKKMVILNSKKEKRFLKIQNEASDFRIVCTCENVGREMKFVSFDRRKRKKSFPFF